MRVLQLVDKPAWMNAVLEPIEVSDRLVKAHTAIVALRADKEHRLRFKGNVRQRALCLLDAIAKSASARGWEVTCPARNRDDHHPADLAVSITGHTYGLQVSENDDKVPHQPTAKEHRDFERWGYPRVPTYDKVPSGRLTIAVASGIPVRQSTFSDTKTINLAERRLRWQQVRDEAVAALREHNRAATLAAQAAQWRTRKRGWRSGVGIEPTTFSLSKGFSPQCLVRGHFRYELPGQATIRWILWGSDRFVRDRWRACVFRTLLVFLAARSSVNDVRTLGLESWNIQFLGHPQVQRLHRLVTLPLVPDNARLGRTGNQRTASFARRLPPRSEPSHDGRIGHVNEATFFRLRDLRRQVEDRPVPGRT
ncbi:hypothetical protein [Kribbella solani]|uniref:Uncharacterized protein n=1 Tax=Kribbella solani TaxID=236067 RepID=A0A841DKT6_9ACTN|nr:hypothetical protein [Kribbella solani]MBB5977290.1 hypothetical protein [Kribbella solani]